MEIRLRVVDSLPLSWNNWFSRFSAISEHEEVAFPRNMKSRQTLYSSLKEIKEKELPHIAVISSDRDDNEICVWGII